MGAVTVVLCIAGVVLVIGLALSEKPGGIPPFYEPPGD